MIVTDEIRPRARPNASAGDRAWPYYPELLAKPVPRYTSYPTAAEFGPDFSGDALAAALDMVGELEPISLYLHIPYCQEICWYCGCNTGAANRSTRLAGYLAALKRESELVGARLGGRGRVRRVAFGGGSPNAISPQQFAELVATVEMAFKLDNPVLSVEVDPRGFDADWARTLGKANVSRVSLGVQTFAPRLQAAIGRVQPIDAIRETVSLLRDAGAASINFDLMYGLPGQSDADLTDTLERALELSPDRLAVFGYAHVPHLIPRQRRIDGSALPDGSSRFHQAELAYLFLTQAGYEPIGFDHFARPKDALAIAARRGGLRRNFQGFTEDDAKVLIGLGASAISEFPDRLLQNEKNAGRYRELISEEAFAVARGVWRNEEDRQRGAIIAALLTQGNAVLPGGLDLVSELAALAPFEDAGLLARGERTLRLQPAALPYARSIAAIFDRYRTDSAACFSAAV
ncbi:oxygen-independent coproporphyrinogen III oxidase [Sphingomonas sp. MS122]|uniref:oxygen-independent coproporphyrinogen III oxidase n=1 Tax=Sphingomonas sp. MS122 TaxID=3412683 RepID=UPI003C303060